MKIVINSTDFSNISTALYYKNPKFFPSWLVSDVIPVDNNGNEYTCLNPDTDDIDMLNDLGCPFFDPNVSPGKYYRVDEGRYFAYVSPEIYYQGFREALDSFQDSDDVLPKEIYYHGNNNRILERDFAEYDFSWLVDKGKFNDKLKIQYLDEDGKNMIGKRVEELTKLEEILFPTSYTIKPYVNNETYTKNEIVSRNGKYYIAKETTNEVPSESSSNWRITDLKEKNYFGTTQIGLFTLFVFSVPPEINKIELYDTIIEDEDASMIKNYDYRVLTDDINGNSIKPCLSIYLGCDYTWKNTDSSKYILDPASWVNISEDSVDNNFRVSVSPDVYFKGLDEERSQKIVWMIITDTGTIANVGINLSCNSWKTDNINPERNKWMYSIRNDEFWATKDNMSILNEKSKIIVDGRSSTILATGLVREEIHPILSRKLKKFNLLSYNPEESYNIGDKIRHEGKLWECLRSYSPDEPNLEHEPGENDSIWVETIAPYSPYCVYRTGEFVLFNGKVWESLSDNNLRNRPDYSKKWIFRAYLTDLIENGRINMDLLEEYPCLNTRVSILINPTGAGRVYPAGQVIFDENNNDKIFSVFENMGYKLKDPGTCSTELIDLNDNNQYNNTSITESLIHIYDEINTSSTKSVRVGKTNESWDQILNSKKLIFNFEKVKSEAKIEGLDNNILASPLSVESLDGVLNSYNFSYEVGSEFCIKTKLLDAYKIEKVKKIYQDSADNILTEIKTPELIDNNEYWLEDSVNYRNAIYKYQIVENTNRISCKIGIENFEMTDNMVDIPYNGNHAFKFYPRDWNIAESHPYENISVYLSDDVLGENPSWESSIISVELTPDEVQEFNNLDPETTLPYDSASIKYIDGPIPYFKIQLSGIKGYIEIKIER